MKVGFLLNQIDNRGTGNAVFDYAHYNEEILGNKSKIFTYTAGGNHNMQAVDRFVDRFKYIYPIDIYTESLKDCDVLYHIKSGYDDGIRFDGVRYAVHAVFDYGPHGDRYAMVSGWLAGGRVPYVPHIVYLPTHTENLRSELEIPEMSPVFGRHGGRDTFDIPFVWDAIHTFVQSRNDVWFVFLNTDKPDWTHPRVIFLEETSAPFLKRKFINTCDAMIHARNRGETFGIAVGEFAICGKPVITYSQSGERAHIEELGNFAYLYDDYDTVMEHFNTLSTNTALTWGYGQYTPENVMQKFNEVFLL